MLETDRETYIEDAAPDGDGYYRVCLTFERLSDEEVARAKRASEEQDERGRNRAALLKN